MGDLLLRLNNDLPKIIEELSVDELHLVFGENEKRLIKILEYQFKLTLLFLPALNLLNYVRIDVLNQVHLKGVNGQGEKKEQDVLLKGLSNIVIDAG